MGRRSDREAGGLPTSSPGGAARHRRGGRVRAPGFGTDGPLLRALRRPAADPLELWESPPFELTHRDGRLYARGVADDKGNLFLLVEAVRQLAAEGELPVNVRFAFDGEEEIGGTRSSSGSSRTRARRMPR